MGNIFERKVSQRTESVWEEISKTLQTVLHWENARTLRVIIGILPCVLESQNRIGLQIR